LPTEALRRVCHAAALDFETTAGLPMLTEVLGQPRAVAALEFGVAIASQGFNLFALGQPGSGKTTLIREYLERRAAAQAVPPDLCYVHNFANSRSPIFLRLPPGTATRLASDLDAFVEEMKTAMPRAFDTAEYSTHRDRITQELEAKRQRQLALLEQHVNHAGFQLLKGPSGVLLVPAPGGKPLSEADVEKLTAEERERILRVRDRLQGEIEERLRAVRETEKAARTAQRALDMETAAYAARHIMDDLRARYRELPCVMEFLAAVETDVIDNADDFRKGKEGEAAPEALIAKLMPGDGENPFVRYRVNVLVDNRALHGAPVVVETNPTYHNLTGRIEQHSTFGAVYTDHTMIKPGALHRANGGYLIIPARECLMNPFAWDVLKRALKDRALRMEEMGAQFSVMSTAGLEPAPVPLELKVVLIGSPLLYYLLSAHDEDFQKLFKVKADFTTRMDRTADAERAYALFVSTITHEERTLPFDRCAVARVIEYGSRAAEDQDQLSTRFGDIADLIREAAHVAGQSGNGAVTSADVRAAEQARRYRHNLMEERLHDLIRDGTLLLDLSGTATGRINGLSVTGAGDFAFGHPVRITATIAPGRRGVVSIEREVELSGPIHGKGVLILGGYLLRQYGQAGPLSLSASLVFEQSYSMVEGDSASLAELCVLISMASGVPLRQDIAVTGSVNQHGQVQPVGGVTEKIEGFFDVCCTQGLSGTQGVLIPASNRRNLMLRDEVVEAVRDGKFHVWTAQTVDGALELLTGMPGGEPDGAGVYPEGTVHCLVADRLLKYTENLRAVSAGPENTNSMERRS